MRKLFYIFPALIISFFIMTGQKAQDEHPRWNIDPRSSVTISTGEYSDLPAGNPEIKQFTFSPRTIITPIGVFGVSPNFRPHPSSQNQQNETDIVRHPTNPNIMFAACQNIINSNNFINVGVYVTTDGGLTWRGRDTMNAPNLNDQRGDPAPIIDKNGNFIYGHLVSATNFGGLTGMGANYSTDNGVTWSATFPIMNNSNVDKNLAGTDDSPLSPYYGNSYMAWTVFAGSAANGRASRTTNGGVSWDPVIELNSTPAGHFAQGHDVAVGPNGEVFVCWTAANSTSPFTEDFVGIAKSTNGGLNYTATENAFDVNGSRTSSFNGWGIRIAGFPRIDIDKSGGPRNGWIYIVTNQRNQPPAGGDADVIINRSTDNGATWSSGIRVNQDPLNNGKVQFFPVIDVDDQGGLNVVYYDNRNFPSVGDSCSVYMSRSIDGGNTWTDMEVADHHFKPKNLPGINTMGDYIGVTSGNNKVWPVWMDDKAGPGVQFNIWSTSVQIATYPLNAFNLLTPPAGSTITSFPNSNTPITLTWDTSASTASYKWIFGTVADPRRLSLPASGNALNLTAGQLDNLLAGLGLAQGQSISGQWDVWAFRNNATNDSLKSANGPRTLTLTRGIPVLSGFNLVSPSNGTTITTSVFNTSMIDLNWTRSGQGTTYKWKFGSPNINNIRLSLTSGGSGYDSSLSFVNNEFDGILNGLGLSPGDSLVGQYAVWAYNGVDSLKSSQTYTLTLRRQAKGEVVIVYDSTSANGRTSKDSVVNNLNTLEVTYDLFNRKGQTATESISYIGYKKIILLGEGTSVISNAVKDSIKTYLNAGGTTTATKSKLLIFSEDIGYQLDRAGSLYLDTTFFRTVLGCQFVADRPGSSGNRGLIGVTLNPELADSTSGPWPDVLKGSSSVPANQLHGLYKFRQYPDSLNGVGRWGTNYNVSTMAVDIESLKPAFDSPPGSPVFRILKSALDFVDGILTSVSPLNSSVFPVEYLLSQNYPNPFNPTTNINFSIPKQGNVTLKIYDVLGKEVMILVNEIKPAGNYEVEFNGSNLSSGAYFFRIESGDFMDIKRMVLIK